jgi:hypothetical protein
MVTLTWTTRHGWRGDDDFGGGGPVDYVEGKRSSVTGGGQKMLAEGGEAFGECEEGEELMHKWKSREGGVGAFCAETEEEMGEGVGASSVRG